MHTRTPRWVIGCVLVALTASPMFPAFAQPVDTSDKAAIQPDNGAGQKLVNDAIQLYEEMEWEQAIAKLEQALQVLQQENAPLVAAQAHWYLTIIARAEGNQDDAKQHLIEVLRHNPDFVLPDTLKGTDFEQLYKDAMALVDRTPPTIHIVSERSIPHNTAVRLVVEIQDTSPIQRVELAYQVPGSEEVVLQDVRQEASNRWVGQIPANVTDKADQIIVRVSAWDSWQNFQTHSETLTFAAKKGGGGGKGLFYVIGGALVAVGGGIAALVLGGSSGTPEEPGNETPPDNTGNGTPVQETWPQSSAPLPPQ